MKKIQDATFGVQKGDMYDPGLAHKRTADELDCSFVNLKPTWDLLCPGYHDWFTKYRLQQFKETVIPSARGDTGRGVPGRVPAGTNGTSQPFCPSARTSWQTPNRPGQTGRKKKKICGL